MEIQSVPVLSIIGMFFSAFIALVLPIILLVVIRKKTKAKISSFFIGCITFVLFALILYKNFISAWILLNSCFFVMKSMLDENFESLFFVIKNYT